MMIPKNDPSAAIPEIQGDPNCPACHGKGYGVLAEINGQPIAMACPCVWELGKKHVEIPGTMAVATPVGVFGLKEVKA